MWYIGLVSLYTNGKKNYCCCVWTTYKNIKSPPSIRPFPHGPNRDAVVKIMRRLISSYCFYPAKWHPSVMTWSISRRVQTFVFWRGCARVCRAHGAIWAYPAGYKATRAQGASCERITGHKGNEEEIRRWHVRCIWTCKALLQWATRRAVPTFVRALSRKLDGLLGRSPWRTASDMHFRPTPKRNLDPPLYWLLVCINWLENLHFFRRRSCPCSLWGIYEREKIDSTAGANFLFRA
jgi:hypothetical protein